MSEMTIEKVSPQPTYIESSGRWEWPLPEHAQFEGCCKSVVTASREWWEYTPSEARPHPMAEGVQLRDGKWYWAIPVNGASNLTRAPVQVTDEDFDAAWMTFRQCEETMGSRKAFRKAFDALSARLAQPVVADVENLVANLQSVHDRWITSTKHDGLDGDFDILLEAINYIKRSQPHPQAAQGGEAQGEAVAWMKTEREYHEYENSAKVDDVGYLSTKFLTTVPRDTKGWIPLYTHPAERAAVPDGAFRAWWAMIEASAEINDEPIPDDSVVLSFMGCGASTTVTAGDIRIMLSAAPTLAGKEKG